MLSINTNLSSLIAQQSMTNATDKLNLAIERMTTGFKINHASDNAANYSIVTNMSTQISAYDVAADNVAMGMDLVNTASDIISNMQDKASRLQALCTQARNGTYGASSLTAINSEASAIMAEINRLYTTAEYNGISLFDREAFELTAEHKALTESLKTNGTASAEHDGFIEDPVTYTDAEVAAMTKVADVSTFSSGQKYSISSVEELEKLADYVNAGNGTTGVEFVLGADIDLSSISNWSPIGESYSKTFKGTFDGNGHVIKNLTIDNETEDYQGLFGRTDSGSTIKNVALEGVNVKGRYSVGGLVGSSYYSSITNSYATGSVTGSERVGGLVGQVESYDQDSGDVIIKNSSSYSQSISGNDSVGSIVGSWVGEEINGYYTPATFTLENCSAVSPLQGVGGYYTYDEDNGDYTPDPSYDLSTYNSAVTRIPIKPTQTTLQVGIYSDSSCQLNFDTNFKFDLSSLEGNIGSDEAYTAISDFVTLLSEKSTQLGAVQNRLDSALESIMVNLENLTSSRSTIRDADIAEVSSEYIQQQILQQASATLLATANQSPSIALQLI